ncbi:globin domain-containing protein [Nocardiopsis ganjiahuensis]|uniref:globin domain-containing protein n=1 Tax=Nocardiopsis ganjiahuensis TaxID=239984 RepID=UPI000349325A
MPLPDQEIIDLVRQSAVDVPQGSTRLAKSFYDNLFSMVPEVRAMFSEDIKPQQQRMADALLAVVQHLDTPDEVADYLRRLGLQHRLELGVLPEHYPHVGRALVRAVSEISPTWSSSMSSAWVLVYQWITANMLAGAEQAEAASPNSAAPSRARHASSSPNSAAPSPARHASASPRSAPSSSPYRTR